MEWDGALNNTTGEIFITWQILGRGEQEIVRFSWTEYGGPSVPKVAYTGFGTELIKAVVNRDLQGDLSWNIAEDGLNFEAIFPLENLAGISRHTSIEAITSNALATDPRKVVA